MKAIRVYEDFESEESQEEDFESEESQEELLDEFITDKETEEFVDRFLRGRGMVLDEMECIGHDDFLIRYNIQGDSIPARISYYIDDLKEQLEEMLGTELTWSFDRGITGALTLMFMLKDEIDPKFIKAKKIMRYS